MTDDLSFLASAYLDGELDADARSQVESSPEILTEVARLRQVRAVLAELPTPSISSREQHLAAALDAWDRLPEAERTGSLRDVTPTGADAAAAAGVAAMTAPSRSTSRRSRRRGTPSSMWLGAAAAGLVVVLAGGLVLRSVNGTDNDSDASTAESSDESGGEQAPAAEAPTMAADAVGPSDLEGAPADTAGAAFELDTGIDDAAPPPEGGIPILTGPDDLAAFAAMASGSPSSGDLPDDATVITEARSDASAPDAAADLPRCLSVDVVVGLAVYDDQQVVVGIDESRDLAIAYLADGCVRVASVSLP